MKIKKLLHPRKIKPRKQPNLKLAKCYPTESNIQWEAALTYVAHQRGRAYLFAVQDGYDKDIVDEHISYRCRSEEKIEFLKKAYTSFKKYTLIFSNLSK